MTRKEMIGIIGGEGKLPYLAREGVIKQGGEPFLFSISGITPSDLKDLFDSSKQKELGLFQLGKLASTCVKHGISKILFVGRIKHKNLYSLKWWKADFSTLRLLISLSDWRADTVLKSIANFLGKRGVTVDSSVYYLEDYLAPKGLLSGIEPTKEQWEDIIFGFDIAKHISQADIGQTAVVKKKAVVAIEGMEGTDKCIQRAGELAGKGATLVKVAKPDQDERFDVPVVGMRTMQKVHEAGVSVVAIEAKRTLVIEPEVYSFAKENNIAFVAIQEPTSACDFS